MDKTNPTGTGSFSLNRKLNTPVGSYSFAEGYQTEARGDYGSHAEGTGTSSNGGYGSHAEGSNTQASGQASHAEGYLTSASGQASHAEGNLTKAKGENSHCEGQDTIATGMNQHVSGKYNIEDTEDKYAEIIGNGTPDTARSNARTLDWNGNEYLAGNLQASGLTDGTTTKAMSEILAGGENKANVDASNISTDNVTSWQEKLKIYPVGSIYMSTENTSPASMFGGTWEQIKDCFLWATGDIASITYTENGTSVTKLLTAGSRGGEATHTLTVNEMPKHQHNVYTGGTAGSGSSASLNTSRINVSNYEWFTVSEVAGGSQPHNNMPPYLAVYCWKRIS